MCQCDEFDPTAKAGYVYQVGKAADSCSPYYIQTDSSEPARLVDEFRFALNDLGDVIAELSARLRPVSQLEYPEPGNSAQADPIVSEARTELHRLWAQVGALRGIVERLEV
jgi:hypothetical protein